MTDVLFNQPQFLDSLAGDGELAEELLNAFFQDSPQRAAELEQALEADDAPAASKLAHSLKGMCGVVRAERLSELALNMERRAKAGRLDEVRRDFALFVESHHRALELMRRYLET